MPTWMVMALVIGLPTVLFGAAFVVGCFEKHPVRMFDPAEPIPLPPYMNAMVRQAHAAGYVRRSFGTHTKFKDKLPAVLMLSPDRRTLAMIAEGTILGMPSKKTILLSALSDGGTLLTVDEAGTAELDPATHRQILMNADFDELDRRHTEQFDRLPPARPFPADAAWAEVDEIYRRRADRIIASGLARYVDADREFFSYTVFGSFRSTIVHGIGQVLRPSNYWRHMKARPRV